MFFVEDGLPISLLGEAAVAAGPSFTFVASGTPDDIPTITIPGTPTAGDLCVIWNVAQGAAAPATVTPSGFTILHNVTGANTRHIISAKKLAGGETTVTGMDGDVREMWICATFHPSSAFTSFAAGGAVGSATSGDPASVNIAASGQGTPVLLLGQMFGGGAAVDPRTISPAMTEIAGWSIAHYAHYKIYNPGDTPADHSYDLDDEGANNGNCACYLTFTV